LSTKSSDRWFDRDWASPALRSLDGSDSAPHDSEDPPPHCFDFGKFRHDLANDKSRSIWEEFAGCIIATSQLFAAQIDLVGRSRCGYPPAPFLLQFWNRLRGTAMDALPLCRASRGWLIVFGLLSVAMIGGCNMLAALGYVAHEDADEAEFAQLVGKRIAVVCRPVEQLQYSDSSAAPDLANTVADLLKKNVKKCQLISSSDVAEWADMHNWNEYAQVGKALKADMVVGIDLEQFSLNEGQTLYKGRGEVHIWVYDMKNGGSRVWDKKVRTVYPPNSAVAASERSEADFRRQYIAVLAEHIARNFYAHDPRADFGSDTNVLND
jgi:hypothetical protein